MNLDDYKIIFLDFDGVIKESVSHKVEAYVELFQPYGEDVCNKIRLHHVKDGGMSRFDKIPLYLEWSNIATTRTNIDKMCTRFSRTVKNKVINSAWVPGIEEFLCSNQKTHVFILVSATPQSELEDICKSLEIDSYFSKLYGSPDTKASSINTSIREYGISPSSCLFIGDMQADIDAAKENKIGFIFRRHQHNQNLNIAPDTQVIDDFNC